MATYFPNQQQLDPLGAALGQGLGQGINQWYLNRLSNQDIQALASMGQTQDIYNTMYGARGLQAPQAQMPQLRSQMGQQMALQMLDPYYQARLQAEKARTAYWQRPQRTTPSPSPIKKMIDEGLLTLDEGKELARKDQEGDLTEKDIISLMHTLERALASTYTALNEPLPGEKYAKRRNYYAEQLEVYRNRLDKLRAGEASPVERDPRIESTPMSPGDTRGLTPSTKPSYRPYEPKKEQFDNYRVPKTEREFDSVLSHIYPKENKKVYFQKMLKRIAEKDEEMAKRLYDKWIDKLYE